MTTCPWQACIFVVNEEQRETYCTVICWKYKKMRRNQDKLIWKKGQLLQSKEATIQTQRKQNDIYPWRLNAFWRGLELELNLTHTWFHALPTNKDRTTDKDDLVQPGIIQLVGG